MSKNVNEAARRNAHPGLKLSFEYAVMVLGMVAAFVGVSNSTNSDTKRSVEGLGTAAVLCLAAASFICGATFDNVRARQAQARAVAIGASMPDRTVYAGISPDAKKRLYTTAADAPQIYDWDGAKAYCEALEADGHKDWRVATKNELNVLFNNSAAIGGFNETGAYPAGWYWSSLPDIGYDSPGGGWPERCCDGAGDSSSRLPVSSLRCIR